MTKRSRRAPETTKLSLITIGALIAAVVLGALPSTQAEAQEGDPGAGGLEIISQSLGTGPAGTFVATLRLPGIIADDDVLTLSIHEPVENEITFLASTKRSLGGVLESRSSRLDALDVDPFGAVDLIIDLNDGSLGAQEPGQVRLVRPGVYPISIDLRTAGQDLVGTIVTYLVRIPDPPFEGAPPLPELAVVVLHDVHASPGTASVGPDTEAFELLITTNSTGTITVTPELIDHLWGSEQMTAVAQDETPWEFTVAPYLRIDEAALLDAGLDKEVDALYDDGSQILRRLGLTAPETLWVTRTLDEDTMRARWTRGVRDVVVTAGQVDVEPSSRPRGPVELVTTAGSVRALIIDDDLLVHASHPDPVLGAYRTLAHLAIIAMNAQRDQTIVLDLSAGGNMVFNDRLIQGLEDLTVVTSLPASEGIRRARAIDASTGQFHSATIVENDQADRVNYTGYRQARDLLSSFSSMVTDEAALEANTLASDLRVSLSDDASPAIRANLWSRATSYVRREISRLDPPPLGSISLTSREALVPFSFQNRADYPVRVEVRIVSEKLTVTDFDDGESTTLLLAPGVTTREFTLRAQTSGSFPVTIELFSPDGELPLGQTRTSVRATAPTGVGLALMVSAAFFLVAWWIIDGTRRRRKARA